MGGGWWVLRPEPRLALLGDSATPTTQQILEGVWLVGLQGGQLLSLLYLLCRDCTVGGAFAPHCGQSVPIGRPPLTPQPVEAAPPGGLSFTP